MKHKGSIAAVYALTAFLTFGHVYNDVNRPGTGCGEYPPLTDMASVEVRAAWRECSSGKDFKPLLAGLGWPAYWAGKVAIDVTKGGE